MRNYYSGTVGAFLLTLFLFAVQSSAAVLTPVGVTAPFAAPLPARENVKLSFGEKLAFKIIQKKWEKRARKTESRVTGWSEGRGGDYNSANHNSVSLIFGILSILFVVIGWSGGGFAVVALILGLILAIAGLAVGITGLKRKYPKSGVAIAGIVFSGIALGMVLMTAVLFAAFALTFG